LNIKIRVAAAVLCITVLFSFSACGLKIGKTVNTSNSSKKASTTSKSVSTASTVSAVAQDFTLPVTLDKSLNPLTTDSMNNLVLWPLMYDCLAEPGQDYAPVMELASSIDNVSTTVTAHLRSGVLFSDGSALTAKDVYNSYELVRKTPSSFFYSNLSNIAYEEVSGSTVIFHLNTPDPLIANLLDIPIIKYGTDTANDKYPTTGINVPPTGTGRYTFSTNSFSGTLSANKSWYKGTAPNFKTIGLINMLNGSATFASLKIGETNLMFTDYGNGALSAAGLTSSPVYLNHMIFMGVNSNIAGLSDPKVRSAISLALNRKTIVSNVFSSRAAATNLPFNPNWSGLTKPAAAQITPNTTLAGSTLSGDGYTGKNSAGALTSGSGGTTAALSYSLLVNKDNSTMMTAAKQIISDLNKIGVIVTLDAQSADNYTTKLSQNQFNLYLGEVSLPDDMDLSPLLSQGGPASFGVPQPSTTLTAFNNWRSGSAAINTVTDAFNVEIPFIPICYKYGSISYTKGLTGSFAPTYTNIFQGIENWHY
jgi:peptide/nickel transport system substrate-binding protein